MHACICGFSNGLGVRVADALSLLLLYSSSSFSRGEDDDDEEEKRENGEKDVGCFVTKITLCDALVVVVVVVVVVVSRGGDARYVRWKRW